MACSKFIIRCKAEHGSFVMENIDSESTIGELKMHLSTKINMKPECIKILSGYPPQALAEGIDELKLKDVNIHSGETIIIEKKLHKNDEFMKDNTFCESGKVSVKSENKYMREAPESINIPSGNSSRVFDELLSGTGIMMRYVVPANNSCLFASVYFILSNGDLNHEKSTELRKVIARVVASNLEKYNSAFLGMSNKEYCVWIQNIDHWGGAIELAILSEHFGIEIVAVDTLSLKLHRFGENSNYNNRIFLIYDGIHYDPLVLELENAPMQTIFPVNDDLPMEMAMEIAREAKSSRQYTDVANFTLRCMNCDVKLRGDKEAREHAVSTGHVQFGEITK